MCVRPDPRPAHGRRSSVRRAAAGPVGACRRPSFAPPWSPRSALDDGEIQGDGLGRHRPGLARRPASTSPDRLLELRCAPIDQFIGVAAIRAGGELEVRAFYPVRGAMVEDPVCGSLNAGLARWLPSIDALQPPYVARQGAALGRDGRLSISREGDEIWIAGATRTLIEGALRVSHVEQRRRADFIQSA